jgi:hypothetical protein
VNRSLATLLALLVLTACAEDPDLRATEFAVRVLDPGTRPGREIVYGFPDGAWPTMQVVVEVDANWSAGDRVDQPAPRLRGRFPVTVRTRPRDGGGATAEVRIGAPSRGFPGCREFSGEIHWSARGRVERFDLAVPPDTPPSAGVLLGGLLERLERLLPTLPEGRVGVGARWKVVRPASEGRPLAEVSTFRLIQARDHSWRLGFSRNAASPEANATASGKGTISLSLPTFYLAGEETVRHWSVHDVVDGDRHQRIEKVLTIRTSVAD